MKHENVVLIPKAFAPAFLVGRKADAWNID
jgi:hypothetical protein